MNSVAYHKNGGDDEDFLFAIQLATNSILGMAMQVAVELSVFEIIAKAGPSAQLSPADIVSQLSAQNANAPAMLDRILRLLASHSILTATTMEQPDGLVEQQYRMKDAIFEGGVAFEKAHGMGEFEYAEADPEFNQLFNRAMFNNTTIIMRKLLEIYKGFDDLKTVVEVGGGIGTASSMIASKYQSVKCLNFDMPHVIQCAPPYPGVEHVSGNMFENIPKSEAIFMKWILHDWDDQKCIKILKNCYKALCHGLIESACFEAVQTGDVGTSTPARLPSDVGTSSGVTGQTHVQTWSVGTLPCGPRLTQKTCPGFGSTQKNPLGFGKSKKKLQGTRLVWKVLV